MFWKIFAVVVLVGVSGQVWFLNTDQSRNTVRIEAQRWVENTLVKSRNLYRICRMKYGDTIICSEWKVAEKPPVFVPNESPDTTYVRPRTLKELFEKD